MNPPSDYLRLRTRPRPETPPQGCVDLSYDSSTGTFVKRDSSGATEAIGGGATAATVQNALATDPDGALAALGSTVNHQSYVAKKVSGWTSSGAAPVRGLPIGDSFAIGLVPGPKMGLAGWIGLGRVSGSGTINDLSGRFDLWLNGRVVEMTAGSVSQFTVGSSASGDVRGNKACIGFIKEASGGSFDLEYQANATGSWIPMGAGTGKNFTVNTGTDVFSSTAHGFTQGLGVRLTNSGGALPTATGGNLAVDTTYYVIAVDANSYKLARTAALAAAGTAIDVTGAGTGTHTATSYTSVGISAANASTIGAYLVFDLPTSTAPFFRLRVTGVNGTSIKIITTGIYNSDGGGVIWITAAAPVDGTTFAQMAQTPTEVLTPVWGGLAPDFVLSAELDFPYEWEAGGNFRTLYNRLAGIKSDMDWIQIGNHNVDENDPGNAGVDVPASNLAMRNWAIQANQTYIDTAALLGSYETAFIAGLMGDEKHLNVAGRQARNNHIWATLPLGHMDLGALGTSGPDGAVEPLIHYAAVSGNFLTQPVEIRRPLSLRGTSAGLRIFSRRVPLNSGASWELFGDVSTDELKFLFAGSTGVIFGVSSDSGIHPSFDDAKCGRTSFRWQIMGTTIRAATYTVATLPSAATRGAGAAAFVSDSNATHAAGLGNTVVGGGANFVPVYSDGTNWKIG